MTEWNVAAAPPQPTGEQMIENIRRLTRPTKIRFSPAITPGVVVCIQDGNDQIIVCSWSDRDLIRDALAKQPNPRFTLEGQASA